MIRLRDQLMVPPPGSTLYPKEEGGGGGVCSSASAMDLGDLDTSMASVSPGPGLSLYGAVMAKHMMNKSLVHRREDLIGSFNSVRHCCCLPVATTTVDWLSRCDSRSQEEAQN